MSEQKETKAQRVVRLKRANNAWEHFDEIREFARNGHASTTFREMRKQDPRPFAVGAIREVVIAVVTLGLVAGAGKLFGF